MARSINRRSALGFAVLAATPAAFPARAAATASAPGRLVQSQPPLAAMLPTTSYFEIDSVKAGARYAVWVATPTGYDRDATRRYAAIYMPDGNWAAPSTIPSDDLLPSDPINPIQPFVHVCVGYVGIDAKRQLAVRARDLLPPAEPPPPGLEAGMAETVKTGLLDEAGAELYIHNLRNPAGDRFLAFLSEELHPLLAARYRLADDGHGLFGYSYGGLFATYAALRRTPLFKRIGAGSPGILPKVSSVFALYEQALQAKTDFSGRLLHMTVNALELTAPTYYQPLVGAGAAEFIQLAGQRPLPGLAFSSRIVEFESHASGVGPSWYDFLRTAYSAKA
jgi:predicted alpha/beta superfamily hydrolase